MVEPDGDRRLSFATSPPRAAALLPLVRPGGVRVSATVPIEPATGVPVTVVHFVARNDAGQLTALVELVDTGAVRVEVAACHPLADLPSVHRDAEAGRTRGKIVLVP
ncbi:zinc-binding dehydrogenase [Micromonospora sp. B11E3]|uniref:zinc-binding dehydrogenase n=1 Tax=Micromonospora sp. B11E3 TaxID=3153562 RepID=UPI00325F3375